MLHWIFFKPLSLLGLLYGMRMLCNENNQDYQDCLFIWIRLVKLKFDLDLYFIWRVLDLVVVVVLLILLSVLFYFKTCIFGFGLWAWQIFSWMPTNLRLCPRDEEDVHNVKWRCSNLSRDIRLEVEEACDDNGGAADPNPTLTDQHHHYPR